MQKPQHFESKPYYPISRYYQNKFNEKVYKVSVSVAGGCPNRIESQPERMCIFCDEWGSAAYHLERNKSLQHQIALNKEKIRHRYRAHKFLVYFQSYTNTFGKIYELEKRFNEALEQEDVVGLVLGTRPDCLPQRLLKIIDNLSQQTLIQIELGVQSFENHQLQFLRRGHNAQCSLDAIAKIKNHTQADVGIHLMFGLPHESTQSIIQTAQITNCARVDNVKLHNLHVLTKTPLAELYQQGLFAPDSLSGYSDKVILFLQHLHPSIAIHRLTAVANRWDELLAPEWAKEKRRPAQFIEDKMMKQNLFQGQLLLVNPI